MSKRHLHYHVHTVLLTKAKTQNQYKCPTDKWIKTIMHICTTFILLKCMTSSKRKEILTFATTWMKLKDIMLRERSQAYKENTSWTHYIWQFKSQTEEKKMTDIRGRNWRDVSHRVQILNKIKGVNPRDLLYNMLTEVNCNVFYTLKSLRDTATSFT